MGETMMTLAELVRCYYPQFIEAYGSKMRPEHHFALRAMTDCHTSACGEMTYSCDPCQQQQTAFHSCGHRFCPKCQHQTNSAWLLRQQQKLLPVNYFMVTFTLPFEIRQWVWHHQRIAYGCLFQAAIDTLNTFATHDKSLVGKLGLTAVLHTHSRRLDYHPHIHVIVPAGAFNVKTSRWHTKSVKFLFNEFALAKVFQARFFELLKQSHIQCPNRLPKKWVAQCQQVGKGESALKYLARYLYRGVINENNIICNSKQQVTFRYKDSKIKQWKVITEPAVQFLWRVLQHVLPKGFRRARDYGFLHCLAKSTLKRIQLMLKVSIPLASKVIKKIQCCPCCGNPMHFVAFSRLPKRTPWRTS